jgi:hypothetical protein
MVYQHGGKVYGSFSISVKDEDGVVFVEDKPKIHPQTAGGANRSSPFLYRLPTKNSPTANGILFLISFLFYGYCIFEVFSPVSIHDTRHNTHWNLLGSTINGTATDSQDGCTPTSIAGRTAVGLLAGTALVAGALLLIGLSPLGPVAGGLFATNMGAGVASGSLMAGLQSAAMTGTAYATGAGIGAAAGAGVATAAGCK